MSYASPDPNGAARYGLGLLCWARNPKAPVVLCSRHQRHRGAHSWERPGRIAERRGNCYVAAEALYHVLGGPRQKLWKPYVMRWRGDTHWFLAAKVPITLVAEWYTLVILDPSYLQFKKADRPEIDDYVRARCTGFLTKRPSRRARDLMRRLTWQNVLVGPSRRAS